MPSRRFLPNPLIAAGLGAELLLLLAAPAHAAERPTPLGTDLYACISTNPASANSTFLVGRDGILVVDPGLNEEEAGKCLAQIRTVSALPIRYVVNTHYHLDHQGGNSTYMPGAVIVSTAWTRGRTTALKNSTPSELPASVVPAQVTFNSSLTIHLEPYTVEVRSGAPGHTLGDAYVYFPRQKAIAAGDLFMGHACPAMDEGSVRHWIATLNAFLATPAQTFVPGHFEIGSREDVRFFRDYLADLEWQVAALSAQGYTLEQVKAMVRPGRFQVLRQFPQYEATFADNAAVVYRQQHDAPR